MKLAKEAYFGYAVMKQSTVHGNRSFPALPANQLHELKLVIKSVLQDVDCEFEDVWRACEEAIGHACRTLRNPRRKRPLAEQQTESQTAHA